MLAKAEDLHIWLKVGDKTIGTYQRDVRPNFNPRLLPGLIPKLQQHGKTALDGEMPDGIRYIAIGTWENREPASFDAAIAAIAQSAQAKTPLIIDVRPNSGGNELMARRVAAMFVAKPTVYAKHVIHKDGRDLPLQQRVLEPSDKGILHPGPCVVLMGNANMSSCEAFLLMMRAAECKLIGAKSGGSSGNPQPHDLGNGVTVFLPSWRSLALDGQELEGVGITPDVVVDSKPEVFQRSDPVLAKALAILRGGG
jgi:C-terminal processing protease CtpA/Prc